ncbi:MAG: hypothetical protein IEMM0006_2109 [bacterium]|nr:MAG: hypothetical protein IEMM0006_2109 [bacterium]
MNVITGGKQRVRKFEGRLGLVFPVTKSLWAGFFKFLNEKIFNNWNKRKIV